MYLPKPDLKAEPQEVAGKQKKKQDIEISETISDRGKKVLLLLEMMIQLSLNRIEKYFYDKFAHVRPKAFGPLFGLALKMWVGAYWVRSKRQQNEWLIKIVIRMLIGTQYSTAQHNNYK